MLAVAFQPDATLAVVGRPDPEPGPGEVVVAVERCGICGTDLHLAANRLLPVGAVPGHEVAGKVVRLGDGVSGLQAGQRVAVLPACRCPGRCGPCRRGRTALCAEQAPTAIGLGGRDGGFAEYLRIGASACHPLPPGVTADQGALVEPMAVAIHAVRRSRVGRGGGPDGSPPVGVIGAGPIGLLTVAALAAAGARVAVAEPDGHRRELAGAMGAEAVAAGAGRLSSALGEAPAVVFDCAGTDRTPAMALDQVRPGGQVVLVGVVAPGVALPMPGLVWMLKEVDVVTSLAYETSEFSEAVQAVAARGQALGAVISAVRPLTEAGSAFADLAQGGLAKVLLAPGG